MRLNIHFKPLIGPININSQESLFHKENLIFQKENIPEITNSNFLKYVDNFIENFNSDNIYEFYKIIKILLFNLETKYIEHESQIDLYIWDDMDEQKKYKIIHACIKFLLGSRKPIDSKLELNSISWFHISIEKALMLLAKHHRKFLEKQDAYFWISCTPSFLISYCNHIYEENENAQFLLMKCIKYSRDQFQKTLIKILDKEEKENRDYSCIHKLQSVLDKQIKVKLLEHSKGLSAALGSFIAGNLYRTGFNEAEDYLKKYIEPAFSNSSDNKEIKGIALKSIQYLLSNLSSSSWSFLWPFLQSNIDICKTILDYPLAPQWIYYLNNGKEIFSDLESNQLKDLYEWIALKWPGNEEKEYGEISNDQHLRNIRDKALEELCNRSNEESVRFLRELASKFPQINLIKYYLGEAQGKYRKNKWYPFSTEEIKKLLQNKQSRSVTNNEELSKVIIESLERAEKKLHGETRAITDLWNTEKNRYHPKNENEISDWIKRHLETDLKTSEIIINREVEIRHSVGKGTGERTDITIEAFSKSSEQERLKVVIEIKGCWNKDVYAALRKQLADRYLTTCEGAHGIYLVVSCYCDKWNEEADTKRRNDSRNNNINSNFTKIKGEANGMKQEGCHITPFKLNAAYPDSLIEKSSRKKHE